MGNTSSFMVDFPASHMTFQGSGVPYDIFFPVQTWGTSNLGFFRGWLARWQVAKSGHCSKNNPLQAEKEEPIFGFQTTERAVGGAMAAFLSFAAKETVGPVVFFFSHCILGCTAFWKDISECTMYRMFMDVGCSGRCSDVQKDGLIQMFASFAFNKSYIISFFPFKNWHDWLENPPWMSRCGCFRK